MINKRFPKYPDDADYTTNSPSYYEDLARKQKLIQLLAEKIWVYENTLDETLEQIEQRLTDYMLENDVLMNERLENWDQQIDEMPEEMRSLFVTWLNDGTLEQIINHDVLGNKADQSEVDNKVSKNINEWFHSLSKRKRHIAHRGLSRIVPENTIPAYDKAGQIGGFWGFETDLIVTTDGEFMLMHDNTVDRTTDGTGQASSFSYREMKALNIDGGFNIDAYQGTKVPDLREFLTVCVKYNAVPILNPKNMTVTQSEKLVNILDEFGLAHNCFIVTYDETALDTFYNIDPKVVIGIIYNDITQEKIDYVKSFPNTFYFTIKDNLTDEKVKMVKSSGLKLCVSTLYQRDYMNFPLENVDFIMTDNVQEGVV